MVVDAGRSNARCQQHRPVRSPQFLVAAIPPDPSDVVRDVNAPHRDFPKPRAIYSQLTPGNLRLKSPEGVISRTFGFFTKRHPHPERSVSAASAIFRMILSSLNDNSPVRLLTKLPLLASSFLPSR